jgi:hypothetical protein
MCPSATAAAGHRTRIAFGCVFEIPLVLASGESLGARGGPRWR